MDALPNFNPSPELSDQLVDLFSDPTLSLQDIAKKFNTTLAALSIYLSRPETQARLAVVDDVNARRVRAVATGHLAAVADSVAQLISASTALGAQFPPIAGDPASYEQTRRRHESTRRAAHLILRLANFYPNQPPRTLHASIRGNQTLHTSAPAQAQQPAAAPAPAPLHPKLEAVRVAALASKAAALKAAAAATPATQAIAPTLTQPGVAQPAASITTPLAARVATEASTPSPTATQSLTQTVGTPLRDTEAATQPTAHSANQPEPPKRARTNLERNPAFAELATVHPP